MKKIIEFLGLCFSYIVPYNSVKAIVKVMEWFYTGYRSKKIRHFGKNSKMGFSMHLFGEDMIEVYDNVVIGGHSLITAFCTLNEYSRNTKIKIGNNTVLGRGNHITAVNEIIIGENLRTGRNVLISDNSHGNPHEKGLLEIAPDKRPIYSKGKIIIGKNVWIGENAVILGNVKIGDGAIVGANSVVTHDVPPFSIAVGCPAKIKY